MRKPRNLGEALELLLFGSLPDVISDCCPSCGALKPYSRTSACCSDEALRRANLKDHW